MFRLAKRDVARSFDRGAVHYDRLAEVQSKIVQDVLYVLGQHVSNNIAQARIVDLGCGTGELLDRLRELYGDAQLIGVDLSPNMMTQVVKRNFSPSALLCVDLEATYLRDESADLVLSSSSLQWANLELACKEMHRLLNFDGHVVVSQIVDGSLENWRGAWGIRTQQMPEFGALVSHFKELGFEIVHQEKSTYTERLMTFQECLDRVHGIGAGLSAEKSKSLGGRARFTKAREKVEKEIAGRGAYPLDYLTELVVAKKVM